MTEWEEWWWGRLYGGGAPEQGFAHGWARRKAREALRKVQPIWRLTVMQWLKTDPGRFTTCKPCELFPQQSCHLSWWQLYLFSCYFDQKLGNALDSSFSPSNPHSICQEILSAPAHFLPPLRCRLNPTTIVSARIIAMIAYTDRFPFLHTCPLHPMFVVLLKPPLEYGTPSAPSPPMAVCFTWGKAKVIPLADKALNPLSPGHTSFSLGTLPTHCSLCLSHMGLFVLS